MTLEQAMAEQIWRDGCFWRKDQDQQVQILSEAGACLVCSRTSKEVVSVCLTSEGKRLVLLENLIGCSILNRYSVNI